MTHAEDPAPYLAASSRTPTRPPLCPRGFFVPGAATDDRTRRETEMSEQQHPAPSPRPTTCTPPRTSGGRSGTSSTRSAPDDDSPREKRYALTMFPYPSGDLHMGHAEVMALHDVIARYWWQQGYDVLNPIGWDSFGLPAENAAIQRNEHPATYTYANIETQAESFRATASASTGRAGCTPPTRSTTAGRSGCS